MKITLCMIVKNEAEIIKDSLMNIIHIIDNAVIADTGSKDETVPIIKNIFKDCHKPLKLMQIKWEDSFSQARNKVLKEVNNGNYVISLDADQKLGIIKEPLKDLYKFPVKVSKLSRNVVEEYLKKTKGTLFSSINLNFEEYFYWKKDLFYKKFDSSKITNLPYLYNNIFIKTEELIYTSRLHEILIREDDDFIEKNVFQSTCFVILHIGYSSFIKSRKSLFKTHQERNFNLLKKSAYEDNKINFKKVLNYRKYLDRKLENKRLLIYSVDYNDQVNLLKGIFNDFFNSDYKTFSLNKTFLRSLLFYLEKINDPIDEKISFLIKAKYFFEGSYYSYLPLIYSYLSDYQLQKGSDYILNNKKYIIKNIALSLIPSNLITFLQEPQFFFSDLLNQKKLFIYGLDFELKFYLPYESEYFKYFPLIRLAYLYYILENIKLSKKLLEASKFYFQSSLSSYKEDYYFKNIGLDYKKRNIWQNKYDLLINKLNQY